METGANKGEKEKKEEDKTDSMMFACWGVLLMFTSVCIKSTVQTKPDLTRPNKLRILSLSSNRGRYVNCTPYQRHTICCISSQQTSSSTSFCSLREGNMQTLQLSHCHTTSHGRKNNFHQIKSSLFWPVSNNEKDPMTWALELPGKLLLLGQQYIISRVLMLHQRR